MDALQKLLAGAVAGKATDAQDTNDDGGADEAERDMLQAMKNYASAKDEKSRTEAYQAALEIAKSF